MLWDQSLSSKNTIEVKRINRMPGAAAILDNHQLSYMYGSQHQKVVIVKGGGQLVAFCGGVDINRDRVLPLGQMGPVIACGDGKDREQSASRSSSSGTAGTPLHDVHCRIEGPAARDLLDVFIQRWYAAREHRDLDRRRGRLLGLGEPMPRPAGRQYVRVGRTFNGNVDLPSGGSRRYADRTVQELFLKGIAAAKRFIYIEDQYMINLCAAQALCAALPRIQHLTILIPDSSISDMPGVWRRRREFIQRLTRSPYASRVHIYCLADPRTGRPGAFHTYVHSKIMIVDDDLAIIGSANMNRRGWEHDSEVAAAIFDAPDQDANGRTFAQRLRMRLWSEHLNLPEQQLIDGAVAGALWSVSRAGSRVRPYNPAGRDPILRRIPSDSQVDPAAPSPHALCCAQYRMSCPR